MLYVLLKALRPVCMKYTAQDESPVANIAQGKTECCICHKTLIKSCMYTFIQTKWQCFNCFIVFYTNLTHFLNKQTGFFVKICQ